MFKYYNHQLIKQNRSYTIDQACKVFKKANLHPQTVRTWIKEGKLITISSTPILIHGRDLKGFLKNRNDNHSKKLSFNDFKCLKCRKIYEPKNNAISLSKNKNGSFTVKATCTSCNHSNNKFFKAKDEEKLSKTFIIEKPAQMTLSDNSFSASKTHSDVKQKSAQNESKRKLNDPFNNQQLKLWE